MENKIVGIGQDPIGWWYRDERGKASWNGPFATPEEAEKHARLLVPSGQKTLQLLSVQAWERRELRLDR